MKFLDRKRNEKWTENVDFICIFQCILRQMVLVLKENGFKINVLLRKYLPFDVYYRTDLP